MSDDRAAESFGERDPCGPTEDEPKQPRRQDSEVHAAVLFDVPLEFEQPPEPEYEYHSYLRKGTSKHQLRRSMMWAKFVCVVATALLVGVFLLVFSAKSQSKEASTAPNSTDSLSPAEAQPPVPQLTCADRFEECVGNRLSRDTKLETGDAICSGNHRFAMGIDVNGSLLWQNCETGEYKVYFEGRQGFSFTMNSGGDFIVNDEFDKEMKKWEDKEDVSGSDDCFETHSGHSYDCPFLHIHNLGRVVLNWEDEDEVWQTKGIKGAYDFGE